MKSTLKIAQNIPSLTEKMEEYGIGKLWMKNGNERFYFDENFLNFAHEQLGFSFEFSLSSLYID